MGKPILCNHCGYSFFPEAAVDSCPACGRTVEAAEAKLEEANDMLLIVHMDGCHTGRKQAEASLAAVMQWARGRCETCGTDCISAGECGGSEPEHCELCTPVWEVEEEI